MNWRFRKRVKIIPGVWVNLNKGTPSLSVGGNGATVNINKNGVRGTLSAHGTGLSVSHQVPWGNGQQPSRGEFEKRLVSLRAEMIGLQQGRKDETKLRRALEICEEYIRLAEGADPRWITSRFHYERGLKTMREASAEFRKQLDDLGKSEFDQLVGNVPPQPDPWLAQPEPVQEERDPRLSWSQIFWVLGIGFVIWVIIGMLGGLSVKRTEVPRERWQIGGELVAQQQEQMPSASPSASPSPSPTITLERQLVVKPVVKHHRKH